MRGPVNRRGGLVILPMPGLENLAHRVAATVVAKGEREDELETPVDVVVPVWGLRPSGEPFLDLAKEDVSEHDCIVLTSGPGTYMMTMQLIYLLGYLGSYKASRITVISAYFPQGRSDKSDGNQLALPPILVDAFRGVSQGRLHSIVCVDPHAEQISMAGGSGFVEFIYLTRRILSRMFEDATGVSDRIVLGYPDGSAEKRFMSAKKKLEETHGLVFHTVFASADRVSGYEKHLEGMTGDMNMVAGAVVLLLDDESATGGSQIKAAARLKKLGAAQVWGGVTHGVLCANAPELFGAEDCPLDLLYVTDTIPVDGRLKLQPLIESGRLVVMPWIEDLAWLIYRLHWGKGIRELR